MKQKKSLTQKLARSIKAIAIGASVIVATTAAEARRDLDINFNDQIFHNNGTIFLKQEINRQYPGVRLERADLVNVRLVAKSRMGQGTAALRVGPQTSRPVVVRGRPQDFNSSQPNTFDRIDFRNPSRNSAGVWQMELNGNIKVRRVVVTIDENNGGPGPGPGPGRTWQPVGTACGPYQPWGTSLQCPTASPHGMNCGNVARGTKCFGASYWDNNFICTNPNTGQNDRGSHIFNMYQCN